MVDIWSNKRGATEIAKGNELPPVKDLIIKGAEWAAVDGILQGAGVVFEFGTAINNIAKETGETRRATLARFFRALKNKGFDMLKNPPTAETLLETVEQLSHQPGKKPTVTVDIIPVEKPVKVPEVIKPPKQPTPKPELDTLNPTGNVFSEYSPSDRATVKLGKNITLLIRQWEENQMKQLKYIAVLLHHKKRLLLVIIITTNKQLAKDYAGTGNVLEKEVKLSEILEDLTEPLGEEYIYRPISESRVSKKPLVKPEIVPDKPKERGEPQRRTPKEMVDEINKSLDRQEARIKEYKEQQLNLNDILKEEEIARKESLKETELESSDDAQDDIDFLEDILEEKGIDVGKLWTDPTTPPKGFVKAPKELTELYRVRDAFYERDIKQNITDVISILKKYDLSG